METSVVTDTEALRRTISVEPDLSTVWQEYNKSVETSFIAQFSYDSTEELAQKEYENRVFEDTESARAVKNAIESTFDYSVSSAREQIIGNSEPHSLAHTCDDITQIANYIRRQARYLLDVGMYAANANTYSEQESTSLLAISRLGMRTANSCSQLSSNCSVISFGGSVEEAKEATCTQINQAYLNAEDVRTSLFHLHHAVERLSEEVDDETLTEIESQVYALEGSVHRLNRLTKQLRNWAQWNTTGAEAETVQPHSEHQVGTSLD